MDNMYPPADGDPQNLNQTQQLGPTAGPGRPGDPGGPGRPGHGGSEPPVPRHHSRSLRWGAGVALAALLAGGGAVAASHLTGGSTPVSLASNSASTAARPTGQAAQLNKMLNSAASPNAASAAGAFGSPPAAGTTSSPPAAGTTGSPSASRAARPAARGAARIGRIARCRRVVVRLWVTGHPRAARAVARACHLIGWVHPLGGMYGQFTFRTKSGIRTIAYERGTVQSDSGGSVVVRAADGTTETWSLTSDTIVRQDGRRTTDSALSQGEQVFVAGPVVGGAHDIRLAVIRPSLSGSAAGSSASGS